LAMRLLSTSYAIMFQRNSQGPRSLLQGEGAAVPTG
jgi:hypothetical protein